MPAHILFNAGMKNRQYTIRQVPPHLDEALRRRAKLKGVSINQVLLDSLAESVGDDAARYHDLDDLAGTWNADKAFEDAVDTFNKVDSEDWKDLRSPH